jgi:lysophospholipase L1-like esterase
VKTLARVAGACVLGWVVLELLGRWLVFGGTPYFVDDVDHRLEPDGVEINADGIRSSRSSAQFAADGLNVVALGDSFTFGTRVAPDEAWPQSLEQRIRQRSELEPVQVANFGWVSSSPLLSLRLLKDIGAAYHPDLVLLALDMTDFGDDLKYARLLQRRGIYRLVGIAPTTVWSGRQVLALPPLWGLHQRVFGFPAQRFFVTNQPLDRSRAWMQATLENLAAIDTWCREELDASFVLAVLPRCYQYSDRESPQSWERGAYEPLGPHVLEPFRFIEEQESTLPYPVVSLLEDFQQTDVFPTCQQDDPHWTAAGHAVAAEALLEALLDLDVLPRSDP